MKECGKDECACNIKKKRTHVIKCKNCGKTATVYCNAKFCSDKCRIDYKNRQATIRQQEKRNKNLDGVENIDFVKCCICGMKMTQIGIAHLKNMHNMTTQEYKSLYPDARITSQKYIDKYLTGENNPCSKKNSTQQERKERSPFSKDFYIKRNLSEQNRLDFIENVSKNRETNNCILYYLHRGYSLDDAKRMLHDRQQTFTLDKCIEKYGEEIGKEVFSERQRKWSEKMKEKYKNGEYSTHTYNLSSQAFSSFEIECVRQIVDSLSIDKNDYYAADSSLGQYEIFDNTRHKRYRYDFIYKNKVIEFNGDYWHMNPVKYTAECYNSQLGRTASQQWKYDSYKLDFIKKQGYDTLTVWESDYKNNKEHTIKRCIDFINE